LWSELGPDDENADLGKVTIIGTNKTIKANDTAVDAEDHTISEPNERLPICQSHWPARQAEAQIAQEPEKGKREQMAASIPEIIGADVNDLVLRFERARAGIRAI
jgi:hypothetical protein